MRTGHCLWVGVAGIALVAAGCIRTDLEEIERGATSDDAGAVSERVKIGETVTTAAGNTVTVHRVDDGTELDGSELVLTSAHVEICAEDDGEGAPSDPRFFRAVVEGEGYRRPAAPVRAPGLRAISLEPGDCARGWVSFPIEPGEDVVAIALLASTVVEWTLT